MLMQQYGLDRLSADERIELIEELEASLETGGDAPALSEAMRAELRRRVDADAAGASVYTEWETVRDEIRLAYGS